MTALYRPGTEETDLKKVIMSLQAIGSSVDALQASSVSWTPTLTFATPGDLSVSYSLRSGYYTKIGNLVSANFAIVTSAFTYTTASGVMQITGLPLSPISDANYRCYGALIFQGINKASFQSVIGIIIGNTTSNISVYASGMGQVASQVLPADAPTGGTVVLGGVLNYIVG